MITYIHIQIHMKQQNIKLFCLSFILSIALLRNFVFVLFFNFVSFLSWASLHAIHARRQMNHCTHYILGLLCFIFTSLLSDTVLFFCQYTLLYSFFILCFIFKQNTVWCEQGSYKMRFYNSLNLTIRNNITLVNRNL